MCGLFVFIAQVNANGVLSFGGPFSAHTPRPFPLFPDRLIAPFWNDIDIRTAGSIFYRFTDDEGLLNQVGSSIRNAYSSIFSPTLLFIATWDAVARFGGFSTEVQWQSCIP